MTAKSKVKILSIVWADVLWKVKFDQDIMQVSPKDEMWVTEDGQGLDEMDVYNRARKLLNLED